MIKLINLLERNLSAKEEKIVKALKKTGKFKKHNLTKKHRRRN